MADLRGLGPCSSMVLQINPATDEERVRQDDPIHWSFGYQMLTGFLERSPHATFRKKTREIKDIQLDELIGQIVAVEPLGNNNVLVIWQTKEQLAQNPVIEAVELAEVRYAEGRE